LRNAIISTFVSGTSSRLPSHRPRADPGAAPKPHAARPGNVQHRSWRPTSTVRCARAHSSGIPRDRRPQAPGRASSGSAAPCRMVGRVLRSRPRPRPDASPRVPPARHSSAAVFLALKPKLRSAVLSSLLPHAESVDFHKKLFCDQFVESRTPKLRSVTLGNRRSCSAFSGADVGLSQSSIRRLEPTNQRRTAVGGMLKNANCSAVSVSLIVTQPIEPALTTQTIMNTEKNNRVMSHLPRCWNTGHPRSERPVASREVISVLWVILSNGRLTQIFSVLSGEISPGTLPESIKRQLREG
jgi:hypothetical protein